MSTIDTILADSDSIRIGNRTFHRAHAVPFRVWAAVAVAMAKAKLQKRRSRLHLSELADHQLRDIGLTRHEADEEVRKSFPDYQRFE